MNRFNMTIDVSVIIQNIKKHLVKILLWAVIIASIAAVAVDILMPATYTATVTFSIWGNEYNYSSYAIRLMNSGVNRYVTLMGSEAFAAELKNYLGDEELPGTITTETAYGASVLNVKCTANSAADAMRMARGVRKVYRNLTDAIDSTYSMHPLGMDDADIIYNAKGMYLLASILIFLLVFFGGMFLVILFTVFDGKVQNLKQAESDIEVPLLGSVVHEKKKKNMLITNNLVSLPYVESYHKLAGAVQDELRQKQCKTVMITSALENEGKSTVAANLALSLAKIGMKVVLVDADLRKPSQHKIFEQNNPGNIADYLVTGQAEGNLVARQVAENLVCCFAAKPSENADTLLESTRMKKLLKFFSNSADVVLVDTSPACVTRDAQVLAEIVDASILVVRYESAPVSQINSAVDTLNTGKSELLGFVFNDNMVAVKQTNNGKANYYSSNYAKKYTRG